MLCPFVHNNFPFDPDFPFLFVSWFLWCQKISVTSSLLQTRDIWTLFPVDYYVLTNLQCRYHVKRDQISSHAAFNDWSKCQHESRLQSKSRLPLLCITITGSVWGASICFWLFQMWSTFCFQLTAQFYSLFRLVGFRGKT